MLKKWETSKYDYNFPVITDSHTFLNSISDIATLLFSLYEDIPNKFYFYKKSKYEIRFSGEQNLLTIFEERLPEFYYSFILSIGGNDNIIDSLITQLFIDKIIIFERKLSNSTITSVSNYYNISNMSFNDKYLQRALFKMDLIVNNRTQYSIIKKKINILKDMIKEKPTFKTIPIVLNIINSFNGRESEFYFEDKFCFSWAIFIISNGNTLWLKALSNSISKKSYDNDINFLVLSIILDDVNILTFYCDKGNNINTIIDNPYEEIKKINDDFINYYILEECEISPLSLSILLNSNDIFKYLVSNVDVDYLSGKYNESAIFFACKNVNFDFIKLLVENNCDLTIENINGNIASELLPMSKEADEIFQYLEHKRKAS